MIIFSNPGMVPMFFIDVIDPVAHKKHDDNWAEYQYTAHLQLLRIHIIKAIERHYRITS